MPAIDPHSSSKAEISKCRATADIVRKTANWSRWLCDGDKFEHRYDPGASFYVVRGQARLTFSDGTTLDIETGDFVSIGKGAAASWDIRAAIETRYCYHADSNEQQGEVA